MNLYDMDVHEYMGKAVKLGIILAAIDREVEFKGAGAFLAEVLGCQSNADGGFWNDQTEMFLSKWQKLAQAGPRDDGYIQNFTAERVAFYREKHADLMQTFFAERAEDYFDETDNDLFYYAISSIAYEAAYLDFDALGMAEKERNLEARKRHDYLMQFEQYKHLAELESQISERLPQVSQAINDYHDTLCSISSFDGEVENMRLLVSHWENELREAKANIQDIQEMLREIGNEQIIHN